MPTALPPETIQEPKIEIITTIAGEKISSTTPYYNKLITATSTIDTTRRELYICQNKLIEQGSFIDRIFKKLMQKIHKYE